MKHVYYAESCSLIFIFIVALLLNVVTAYAEQAAKSSSIEVLERPAPKYPTLALINKTEGWVKVVFTIDEKGNVIDPAIVDSQPRKIFDLAAYEAVQKFKFKPRIVNGKPVSTRANQKIEFYLPDDALHRESIIDEDNPVSVPDIVENIKQGDYQLHDDIIMLVKSIETQSKIKIHMRSNKEFETQILVNDKGYPSSTRIIKNTYGKRLNKDQIRNLKALGLEQAQLSHAKYHGYFNPVFKISHSKTQPARIIPTTEAKSMPLPEYHKEITFKSNVTINEKGIAVKALNSTMEGQPATQELALIFLEQFSFFKAMKRGRPVEDELNLTITFAVVQIANINEIRNSLFNNL